MNLVRFSRLVHMAFILLLTACQPAQQASQSLLSRPGDMIAGMSLGIGDLFALAGERFDDVDWSAFDWQLSLDDEPLDLQAFGTFDYIKPVLPQKPSQLAEAFKKFTAWDIESVIRISISVRGLHLVLVLLLAPGLQPAVY